MYSAVVVQEVLQRSWESWRWGAQWLAIGSWQRPIQRIIKADPLTTTQKVAKEHSMVIQHLKQTRKVKKLGASWANHKSKKIITLMCCLLLFHATMKLIWLWHAMRSVFYTTSDNQLSGWTEKKLQSTSQSQTLGGLVKGFDKKGHDHCLVICCLSDLLWFSEPWQNHSIWEVCPTNRWDAPKTAMLEAGTTQQKKPQFFSMTTLNHTWHNDRFKSWMNRPTKFCLILHIQLTSCQLTTTSSSMSKTFCR